MKVIPEGGETRSKMSVQTIEVVLTTIGADCLEIIQNNVLDFYRLELVCEL